MNPNCLRCDSYHYLYDQSYSNNICFSNSELEPLAQVSTRPFFNLKCRHSFSGACTRKGRARRDGKPAELNLGASSIWFKTVPFGVREANNHSIHTFKFMNKLRDECDLFRECFEIGLKITLGAYEFAGKLWLSQMILPFHMSYHLYQTLRILIFISTDFMWLFFYLSLLFI